MTKEKRYNCIIIGAGAAGLFHAAADTSPGPKLILEKTPRPGQKLLMSGAGMCNITHGGSIKDFPAHYGKPGGKIRGCLYRHSNLKLMEFLEDGGIPLTEREDGKIFPASLKASDILDFLLSKAKQNGYEIRCSQAGESIPELEAMLTRSSEGITGKLIVATGGASYPGTGSDGSFMKVLARDLGIEIAELRPALAPIYIQNYPYAHISGVSIEDVELKCDGHASRGPLLFTHKGLSGPAILHMSQHAKAGLSLQINFLPDMNREELLAKLKKDQPGNSRGLANYISQELGLPKAFAESLLPEPSRKLSSISGKELNRLAEKLTASSWSISGCGGWNEAMVTAGGVSLKEINTKNMSLTAYPHIRVIGEALDINGDTGGYNLQFAYSSAMAALD